MAREDRAGLITLVRAAQAGHTDGFTRLMRRFECASLAYACRLTGDWHLAEEATQEAFVTAYLALTTLRDPAAFPGWLRGILRHVCLGLTEQRRRSLPWNDLSEFVLPADDPSERETALVVRAAVEALPPDLKAVTRLYYLHDYTQGEVADRLGVALTTVNNRLHTARSLLRRRLIHMAPQTPLASQTAASASRITALQPPFAEIHVSQPLSLFDTLTAGAGAIPLTVVSRLDDTHWRCLVPVSGPTPQVGDALTLATANPSVIQRGQLAGVVQGRRKADTDVELLDTGIKALDFLCPIAAGGVAICQFIPGLGFVVLMEELLHRRKGNQDGVTMVNLVRSSDLSATREMRHQETPVMGRDDRQQCLELIWLPAEMVDPDDAVTRAQQEFDSVLYFTPLLAVRGLYPALDPLYSGGKLLCPEIVGKEHYDTWRRFRELLTEVRALMADPVFLECVALRANRSAADRFKAFEEERLQQLTPEQREKVRRVRQVEQFLAQPFYVAEPFTGKQGETLSRAETVKQIAALLNA